MDTDVVFVVDDDPAVRDSLAMLVRSAGWSVETYDRAASFLAAYRPGRRGCLILDVRMPGMGGPELQAELKRRKIDLPVIFLTAHGDIPTTVKAIKAGAMDFLTKPVNGAVLLERVRGAIAQSARLQSEALLSRTIQQRVAGLSAREREVMALAAAGHSNKMIAQRLGISFRTVEAHRAQVMNKTGAANVVELSRIAAACGMSGVAPGPNP